MTPLYLKLLLPAVQVVGAGLISSRISWRHHPALIAWLFSEVFLQGVALSGSPFPQWAMVPKLALMAAVAFEVLRYSRFTVASEWRALAACGTLGVAALCAARPEFTALQRAYLFRSYVLLALALSLVGAVSYRCLRPVLESHRHRAYRIGAAAWMLGLAASGAFVRGGLGYQFLPYTRETWALVNLASYWWTILSVAGLSLAMWMSVTPRRAAKTGDAWIARRGGRKAA